MSILTILIWILLITSFASGAVGARYKDYWRQAGMIPMLAATVVFGFIYYWFVLTYSTSITDSSDRVLISLVFGFKDAMVLKIVASANS